MKLKSMDVIGFKSFVDRLHLTFPAGITTVVGPNGCGKSNIVDAILWAIGERSAKHLRGRSMEDVIFNGANGRKPMGMAEVNLTFSNEDGLAPKGYEHLSEMTITRRLFRSGESEYLLNKVPCRLRDITDLFLDTGIGVNGYSIVEQGRVESLINANPEERRFLIEEAAGIAKYKERKRLALMKMEAAQQNLLRIQDIIAEVKRQIVSLERQVNRAEEYKAIRKEIKEIETRFALEEYGELLEKGEAIKGYLKALREREVSVSQQTAEKEAWIEGMKLTEMEQSERLQLLQQEFFGLGQRIQKAESEVQFLRRERDGLQRQVDQAKGEVRDAFLAWREAERERRRVEQSRRNLEEERRRTQEDLRRTDALVYELKGRHNTLLNQLEDGKTTLINTLTQITSLKNRLSHLEERRGDLQKRVRSHQKESEETGQELTKVETALSQMVKEKKIGRATWNALREEMIQWEGEVGELKGAWQQKQTERLAREDALRQENARYLSLKELQDNYEGYEKGVRSILLRKKEGQEGWDGIVGSVADLLEPDPSYEIPLEAVLGERLQYLVVEDEKKGQEAIAFLKKESLGRGNFIPKGVRGKRARGSPLGEIKKPLPLDRFVKVKEECAPLVQFLIGHIGVVDDWQEALDLMAKDGEFETFVTLEGDVLERCGILSGGSRDQGLGLLERRREIRDLEKKIKEREEECRNLSEEEECLKQQIFEKEGLLTKRRKEVQEKEIQLLHQEKDSEGLRKEISQLLQKLEILQFEKKELMEEDQDLEKEMKEFSMRLEAQETARREMEGEVQSLKQQVEESREEIERVGREITERKVLLASLEEKVRATEAQGVNLSETRGRLKEQVIRKIKEIREGREKECLLLERIDGFERELERDMIEHRQREEALVAQREKVEAISNELKGQEASSRYLRQEMEEVRQKLHEEEIRSSEVQLKAEHLLESMRDRYGVTLAASVGISQGTFQKEEMLGRLEELKKALEGFGEVNLMAMEEYQELKRRHDFLTEQQADLQQALDSLRKAIVRINRTTTKRFLETFHLVNEKFQEIFVRLFKGGQASLLLLDEQDPSTTGVNIVAQPPGKRLQNIDLLSGGEKALVAIAFLFGLFRIKPSPFCLLDEVDAPLDDVNIHRFIELIKELSKTSQFVLITHNKETMEAAHTLYGVTMETPGVSKLVSVRLN